MLARDDAIAMELLNAGADPNSAQELGAPLQVAAQQGMFAMVEYLLERDATALVAGPSREAIVVASAIGYYDIVALMLKRGRDENLSWDGLLDDALRAAASEGHEDIARILIDSGANPRAHAVLHTAVSGSNAGLVRDLIKAGASVDSVVDGFSVLDVAVTRIERGNSGRYVLRALVDAGADICSLVDEASELSKNSVSMLRGEARQCNWPKE